MRLSDNPGEKIAVILSLPIATLLWSMENQGENPWVITAVLLITTAGLIRISIPSN